MNINNPNISINNTTAIALMEFLATPAGKEVLGVMRESTPPLIRPGEQVSFEVRALRSTETQTWQSCVDFLVSLASIRKMDANDSFVLQGEP